MRDCRRNQTDRGFSVFELLIIMAIMSIMMGIVVAGFRVYSATIQGDAEMRIVEWQLKLARETAINQRRTIEVQFTPPNLITLVRNDLPAGTTVLSTIVLEHNTAFRQFPGEPDTPDTFGNSSPVTFGGAASVMFTADGMFTDQAGNPVNGSIFLEQIGQPMSARALTVFGPTARIRTYRWNGTGWRP